MGVAAAIVRQLNPVLPFLLERRRRHVETDQRDWRHSPSAIAFYAIAWQVSLVGAAILGWTLGIQRMPTSSDSASVGFATLAVGLMFMVPAGLAELPKYVGALIRREWGQYFLGLRHVNFGLGLDYAFDPRMRRPPTSHG